jgi:hypothetical protein
MTIAQFRKRTQAAFKAANPDADPTFRWIEGPKRVKTPTGLTMVRGKVRVDAKGYKSTVMYSTWTKETGLMVR